MQTAKPQPPKGQATYEELLAENATLQLEVFQLKEKLSLFERLLFGQKRERFVPGDDRQLELGLDANKKEIVPLETEEIHYNRRKRSKPPIPPVRQPLPSHLPRKDIVIEPQEDTHGMQKIGEEITEELEYEPGKFYVNRYIRPKYARPNEEGVVIGQLPSRPIEKGIPGPGLLSHILISKFVDHLPLYRQQKQFKRLGVNIADSTLVGWVKAGYELLLPLYEVHTCGVLSKDYLMVDETPIKVLEDNLPSKSHTGYFWVYYDPLERQVYFNYQPNRGRDGPKELLKTFQGYLQSDGYGVYDDIASPQRRRDSQEQNQHRIIGVGCFAHARRYFDQAKESDPPRSEWMLLAIQQLYGIERQAREEGMSFEERYRLRQERSQPILNRIKEWSDQECLEVLPKSLMGKAIGYMLNQWPKLQNYLLDGRLEIDNNLVENAIRPVALGRKNYLFAGSHEGAKRAALVYSLVATAKLHEVEPFEYLQDIIGRISDYPYQQITDLLPANWKTKFKK
jgi:transposase